MTAPMGLAEMVPREITEHSWDRSGKGNGGQEVMGQGKQSDIRARGLDPGH